MRRQPRRRSATPLTRTRDRAFLLGLLLTAGYGTAMVLVFPTPDWDFHCYLNAGHLVRAGRSPYSHELGTHYQYPPLLAHAFGAARAVLTPAAIFSVYQVLQVALLAGAFCLLRLLALRAGAGHSRAAIAACLLCTASFPIFYTLRQQQVNLAMLDASLLAMLFPARSVLVGLALGAATQLKLYPALLLVPLGLFGYFRIAFWWAVGMTVPLVFEGVRADWVRFLELLPHLTAGEAALNNSVASLLDRGMEASGVSSALAVRIGAALAGTFALVVVGRRTWRRLCTPGNGDRQLLRCCAEWLALALFLSPIAWDHQFVLALPLVALLVVECPRQWLLAAGAVLMLWLPRTPVYPLSHHYLAGAALLFIASGRSRRPG